MFRFIGIASYSALNIPRISIKLDLNIGPGLFY